VGRLRPGRIRFKKAEGFGTAAEIDMRVTLPVILLTDLRMLQNATTELQGAECDKAITDGAPYPVWPASIRQVIEKDYREVQFAFHFN